MWVCARASLKPAVGSAREARGHSSLEGVPEKGECEGAPRASAGECASGGEGACQVEATAGGGAHRPAQDECARVSGPRVPARERSKAGARGGRGQEGVVARGRGGAGRQGGRGRGTRARAAERAPAVTWAKERGRENAREGGGWGG